MVLYQENVKCALSFCRTESLFWCFCFFLYSTTSSSSSSPFEYSSCTCCLTFGFPFLVLWDFNQVCQLLPLTLWLHGWFQCHFHLNKLELCMTYSALSSEMAGLVDKYRQAAIFGLHIDRRTQKSTWLTSDGHGQASHQSSAAGTLILA